MKKIIHTILTITILCFLSHFTLAQTTHLVTNTNNAGIGSLRQAVIDANDNDIVRFDLNLLSNGSDTIVLLEDITFNQSLTIKGLFNSNDTLFISGGETNRIFTIYNTTKVVLDSLNLINGLDSNGTGGAVSFVDSDSLIVTNSVIRNNKSINFFGQNSYGGGIYLSSSLESIFISLYNSRIVNNIINSSNYSDAYGGGIYISSITNSKVSILKSKILSNTLGAHIGSGDGGGLYSKGDSSSVLLIDSSEISNNQINVEYNGFGGGIVSIGVNLSDIMILNSSISDNYIYSTSDAKGGGIYSISKTASIVNVFDSQIKNNTSKGSTIFQSASGGGIYSLSNNHHAPFVAKNISNVTISNSVLENNLSSGSEASHGGGVYSSASSDILGSTPESKVVVISSTFTNNKAFSRGVSRGGGVYSSVSGIRGILGANSIVEVINSTFNLNKVSATYSSIEEIFPISDGAGIFSISYPGKNALSSIKFEKSTFSNNQAGASRMSSASILNSSIKGSTTDINGASSVIEINNSTLVNNGFYSSGNEVTTNNNFSTIKSSLYDHLDAINSTSKIVTKSSIVSNTNNFSNSDSITIESIGYNIFSDSVIGVSNLDYLNIDSALLLLDTLSFNGGGTKTHMPLIGSVSLNRGTPNDSSAAQNSLLNGRRDIGAAENNSFEVDSFIICDSLIWNNQVFYTSNNSATDTIINGSINGSDSIIILDLQINYTKIDTTYQEICFGDSIYFDNSYIKNAGLYIDTLISNSGCDSIQFLNLIKLPYSHGVDSITSCTPILWIDGNIYSTSNNTASYALTNSRGCDSIITLNLTINSNTGIDTIISCHPLSWIDGNIYLTSNNTASFTLTNSLGCDSLVTLNYTRTPPHYDLTFDSIASCTPIVWIDGNTYSTSNNTASYVLTNSQGCDSTVMLRFTLLSHNVIEDITSCSPITWIDGNIYASNNNTATYTLTNSNGCDSVITLNFTLLPPIVGDSTTNAIPIANLPFSDSGNTNYCYTNSVGNPSADVWYSYTVPHCTDSILISLCGSTYDTYLRVFSSNGQTELFLNDDNNLGICYVNSFGSVSSYLGIHIPSSTINPGDLIYIVIEGHSNNQGEYSINITDTPTLHSSIDSQIACNSYTWVDGNTYTANNDTSTFMLTSAEGCDSIVTLNLTITDTLYGIDTISAYDSIVWIDGNTYYFCNNSATHTLTSVRGCDSIITLNLTILNPGTDTQTACDSYTWIDGNIYTTSNNIATHSFINSFGCDSIVTLDLNILNSTHRTDSAEACLNYTWINGTTYTSSNNSATYILTNVQGCDSVIHLDLTIHEINDNISILFPTLTSNEVGGIYQWLNCDSNYLAIQNATDQSFTPPYNGNYAVEIISTEGCVDTTNCRYVSFAGYASIDDGEIDQIKLYPNPTKEYVTIELNDEFKNGKLSMLDLAGKVLFYQDINNQPKVIIETSKLAKGIYILQFNSSTITQSIRLVKQ